MFQYEIMTEQEAMAERFKLLKEGLYDAIITSSEDRQSSTGNPMMALVVTVYDENGKSHEVRDFLVFTKTMMWKVIHFANSAGLMSKYEEGKLCSKVVIESRVKVKIGIEEGSEIPEEKLKGKPKGSKYPDKNRIEEYVPYQIEAAPKEGTLYDNDVPFL